MKILALSHSDVSGGAARAAYRIHLALRASGVDSTLLVNEAKAGDWTVQGPVRRIDRVLAKLRGFLGGAVTSLLETANPVLHSPSVLPSSWPRRLNAREADVVHLHWIQDETMSVADVGRSSKPVVWTLHDMWAFCGAEHYTEEFRWREGYRRDNRPSCESGFDLNLWTWRRKRRAWRRPMHIVTPSRWLAACVKESALMGHWPVTVVPNPLDTEVWRPIDKALARRLSGLPSDGPLLLFCASGEEHDPRKGLDRLQRALACLRGRAFGLRLVVLGRKAPKNPPDSGFPLHYVGYLHDDISLRLLYSAADALAIPSRQDNLPNTGVESLACGTPVVAFDSGGLPDIVAHRQTGYLARAFCPEDFAEGVRWVLENAERHRALCLNARRKAVQRFSYPVVAAQYRVVYEEATHRHRIGPCLDGAPERPPSAS